MLATESSLDRRLTAVALTLVGVTAAAHLRDLASPPASTLTVIVKPGFEPELVAYRPYGDKRWSILDRRSDHYEITVADRYTLVFVCPASHGTVVHAFELAARDLAILEAPCVHDRRPVVTTPVRFVDPAVNTWVANEFAGVSRDGDGRIVGRDAYVELPVGSHDWITLATKPLRVALEHDVPASKKRKMADVRGGAAVDRLRVHVPGDAFASVEFISRNRTHFSGLGESRVDATTASTLFDVVPHSLRLAGDRDVVHGTGSLEDKITILSFAKGVESLDDVTITMPKARPRGELHGNEARWSRAGDPDLITFDRNGNYVYFTIHISRRWLDGATRYRAFDEQAIPGWRWPELSDPEGSAWLAWSWTSTPSSLPFDTFSPPTGVTYTRVMKMMAR